MLNKKAIWQHDVSEVCNSSTYKVKLSAAQELLNMAVNDDNYRDMLTKVQSKVLLESLWISLKPDTGQKLPGVDELLDTLKMHLVALKILQVCSYERPECLTDFNIITQDNLRILFDMLTLDDSKGSHRQCCHHASQAQWSDESLTTAHNLMYGRQFKAQLQLSSEYSQHSDIYRASLYQHDGTDVVKIMSNFECLELSDIIEKIGDNTEKTVKVTEVLSPEYVWVQLTDNSAELTKLSGALAEYVTTAPPPTYNESHVAVAVPGVDLVFRARAIEWAEASVKVFAMDYGWSSTVPVSSCYSLIQELVTIPPHAVLCKLINVKPSSLLAEIQVYSLQILQDLSVKELWSSRVLAHPQILSIVKLLKYSTNTNVLQRALHLLSALSDNTRSKESLCNQFLELTLGTAARCFLCPVVLCAALQFFRNLVITSLELNKNKFINCGGPKLVLKAYRTYMTNTLIQSHCLHILKRCLKDFEFEVVDEQLDVDNFSDISVSHCEPKPKFSHMDNMRQYGIKENEHVAFAENCLKKLDTKALCKEIVSFMNSRDGGVIYVGVSTAGIIKGLELNRQRKDDCLLMIDNLLTKMILNHKGVKVPGHCVDTTFQTIDNRHNQHLPDGTSLAVCVINVKPSFFIARLLQGEIKYWRRGPEGAIPMTANEMRQKLVRSE